MPTINIHDAKTHFSKLLSRAESGEEIIIAKAGKPVAQIIPLRKKTGRRLAGPAKSAVTIQEDSMEPLTVEQSEKIKHVAARRQELVAEVIRQAVDGILKSDISVDFQERRKRVMEITGKYASGKGDISSEHDAYIAEALRS
jgi:prevent-host-death family protein